MTAHTTFPSSAISLQKPGNRHRGSVMLALFLVFGPLCALAIYGVNYYALSQARRPLSPKHHLLKPGGVIGIDLGVLGALMLCAIFVYPLRKRWGWLRRQGDSRHWLDYHVVLGIAAPIFIAFHASFKFRGLAGFAFWIMLGVAISGLVGRYLYGLTLRQVAVAESSLRELREILASQRTVQRTELRPLLSMPAPAQAARWPAFVALGYVMISDLARPFRIARLRVRGLTARQIAACWLGMRPTKNIVLEWVIALACKQEALSKRVLFLSQMRRVFQLWHVVHRPFSYAFAVLALFHIFIAMLMGFI